MEPELISVKLVSTSETSTRVEIQYRVQEIVDIELMGVDANLSWLKGEALLMEKTGTETIFPFGEYNIFRTLLDVETSCEFRARGYKGDEDYWESGLENHKIERNEDSTINFMTNLHKDEYLFNGDLLVNYEPNIKEIEEVIYQVEDVDISLFQLLVHVSIWSSDIHQKPLSEKHIHAIPSIVRVIKRKLREKNSYKVDKIVRPIFPVFFEIYRNAMEFDDEDEIILSKEWQKAGFFKIIQDIPNKIKELDELLLGRGKDAEKRFLELLKYN